MNTITGIKGELLKNSRGTETICVTVQTENHQGSFMVPEGASTGSTEVLAKSASEALSILEEKILPQMRGIEVTNQKEIDAVLHEIDQSELFEGIGGNTALGVSVAVCKTAAKVEGVPTWKYIERLFGQKKQAPAPRLFVNLINGGKHATFGSPIQEHQIIPDTPDVALAYSVASDIYLALEKIVTLRYGSENIGVGDEGGFMLPTATVFEPFELLEEAIALSGASIPVAIGADIAASSFFDNGVYKLIDKTYTAQELLQFYADLHTHVPNLRMVEDPFFETDFDSFAKYRHDNSQILVIGDDLTTTNKQLLQKALQAGAINGIIIKPNQIGTLTDTLATMLLAYENEVSCIVSHRSGETQDDFIADLAFGTHSFGLKAGAPFASERKVKYQRLIHIQNTSHD